MATQISPMLAVNDSGAAIAFYKAAFGATVLWEFGEGHVIAGLSIGGARFFLAPESPEFGTRSPNGPGFTSVRIELFVDDPVETQRQAVAAGATELNAVCEDCFETVGPEPISRMLQGAVRDPFGHIWLIGRFLEE